MKIVRLLYLSQQVVISSQLKRLSQKKRKMLRLMLRSLEFETKRNASLISRRRSRRRRSRQQFLKLRRKKKKNRIK